ncbi:hypothetical protein [Paraburkholderia phytofirmans]|uniref:hypothetical protein n=1 Tax=Paraburkholderia TaxID=1822464 RepID=UPI0015E88A8C|nr:hypothetical protein [Paraburkholderia phytofirmans]
MAESWTGVVVGLCGLSAAALLIAVHYRREMMRQRKLRQMDHRDCWEVMRQRR